MRKLIQLVILSSVAFAAPVFADMKIAVLNYQQALLESDAAKKYAVDAEKKYGPQLNKLRSLEASAKESQQKLNDSKLSKTERTRLEDDLRQKARDFQFQSKELNEAKAASDRETLQMLKPKLDKAVEEVLKKGNYDLVIERGAVVDVKPQYDITRAVIERLNQQK